MPVDEPIVAILTGRVFMMAEVDRAAVFIPPGIVGIVRADSKKSAGILPCGIEKIFLETLLVKVFKKLHDLLGENDVQPI